MKRVFGIAMMLALFTGTGWAHEGGKHGVHFVSPINKASYDEEDGIHVVMAVEGMQVQKAGELQKQSGHFHIIIDGDFVPEGKVVVKDANHMHFGKGQTEATLKLPDGEHTLTLQFDDGRHVSYGEDWSQTIHIKVD